MKLQIKTGIYDLFVYLMFNVRFLLHWAGAACLDVRNKSLFLGNLCLKAVF